MREGESKQVSLPKWAILRHNSFKVGQVCKGEGKFQLLLLIPVSFSNVDSKRMKILFDMGAEANLNKTGLVPSHSTYLSKDPLTLVAANRGKIPGGDRGCNLQHCFKQEMDGTTLPDVLCIHAEFFEADIGFRCYFVISVVGEE